ncbi:chemotaxis protein CheW [Tolypothrix sp. FACHB-123]|uniref:chemotaxis protein CheW n=1 Tax=Tolypothrix sp. FACHB-123 TaxID=2692868 RepID=UPI0016834818|nr:chemotaxis protein CheW [Tolypothrix sp. FACHB-123]MBD2358613.1 chemotaxis protein CheW [Tolypothrix sp. FACHB-123]
MAFDSLTDSTTVLSSTIASKQFLRFQLVPQTTLLLPISQLVEVLTIAVDRITPIPQLPAWVMGAYNWRGEVLWMVDLAHLIGFTPWYQQGISTTCTVIVLRAGSMSTLNNSAENQMIGLVINRAEMMEWCDRAMLQPPSSDVITPELIPFVSGYQLKSNGERLAVLDDQVIITAISQSN